MCHIHTSKLDEFIYDGNGLSKDELLDKDSKVHDMTPESLLDAVTHLKSYFNKELKYFNLKLNPESSKLEK